MQEEIVGFLSDLWSTATLKHEQGVYNTVCLAVLLALPLVVLLTTLLVCCHCCCCRHGRCCGARCCPGGGGEGGHRAQDKRGKKNGKAKNEDLWISVKSGPMTPDVVGLSMV